MKGEGYQQRTQRTKVGAESFSKPLVTNLIPPSVTLRSAVPFLLSPYAAQRSPEAFGSEGGSVVSESRTKASGEVTRDRREERPYGAMNAGPCHPSLHAPLVRSVSHSVPRYAIDLPSVGA